MNRFTFCALTVLFAVDATWAAAGSYPTYSTSDIVGTVLIGRAGSLNTSGCLLMQDSFAQELPSLASEVFATAELARRSPKKTDYLQEKLALQDLATQMADRPERVLPRFVELAMGITGGISAGLSLYEEEPSPGIFRWHYVCGTLATFDGATTPRNDSPCGVTLVPGITAG